MTVAALVGQTKNSVTSKSIHTLNTALIMVADTIAGYIQVFLDRKAALPRFLRQKMKGDQTCS